MSKSWAKPIKMARKCKDCGSQRPGMQPLTLFVKGKPQRGYWHLKCFGIARSQSKKIANRA